MSNAWRTEDPDAVILHLLLLQSECMQVLCCSKEARSSNKNSAVPVGYFLFQKIRNRGAKKK